MELLRLLDQFFDAYAELNLVGWRTTDWAGDRRSGLILGVNGHDLLAGC
jgi:hypothetical protein